MANLRNAIKVISDLKGVMIFVFVENALKM